MKITLIYLASSISVFLTILFAWTLSSSMVAHGLGEWFLPVFVSLAGGVPLSIYINMRMKNDRP